MMLIVFIIIFLVITIPKHIISMMMTVFSVFRD